MLILERNFLEKLNDALFRKLCIRIDEFECRLYWNNCVFSISKIISFFCMKMVIKQLSSTGIEPVTDNLEGYCSTKLS